MEIWAIGARCCQSVSSIVPFSIPRSENGHRERYREIGNLALFLDLWCRRMIGGGGDAEPRLFIDRGPYQWARRDARSRVHYAFIP